MTSLSYEDIFSDFLGYITDYKLASLSINDANELLVEYLHKTLSKPYVRHVFSSATLDDEIQTFKFEMEHINDESADLDFVRNILCKGMVVEWLSPQVRSKLMTAQMFTGKEQNFFSQASHLTQLRGLLEDTDAELRKIIRDRGYISNSYLESDT